MLPALALPVTVSDDNDPTLVIFGCAAVVNVPATKFAVNKLPALTLPAPILPLTVNEPSVPTLVKLEFTMFAFSVVPLRLAALAVIAVFAAAVN